MSAQRELVAIPAWNEQSSIADVVAKVAEHGPQADVFVVSDESTDRTAELAAAGACVVTLLCNVGVGGAMRTAFLFAQRAGYDSLVQVDADGQHNPADFDRVLDGLAHADVVIGTRFQAEFGYFVGGPRRWEIVQLSKVPSWMNKGTTSDPTDGFCSAGPRAIELLAVAQRESQPETDLDQQDFESIYAGATERSVAE